MASLILACFIRKKSSLVKFLGKTICIVSFPKLQNSKRSSGNLSYISRVLQLIHLKDIPVLNHPLFDKLYIYSNP